jgi:hypothetical protein
VIDSTQNKVRGPFRIRVVCGDGCLLNNFNLKAANMSALRYAGAEGLLKRLAWLSAL